LNARGDLRHPRVLIEHGVAEHAHFQAEDVLIELEVRAEPECRAGIARIERLTRQRQFHAISHADHHAICAERVILRVDIRAVNVRADLVRRAVTADHGPRRQAAARRALHFGHAARQQQFPARERHDGRFIGEGGGRDGGERRRNDAGKARGQAIETHCVFPAR
jgi:hypothetical protein